MSLTPQFGAIVPSPTQTPSPSAYLAFNGGANDFRSRALWKQNVIWILKNGWR